MGSVCLYYCKEKLVIIHILSSKSSSVQKSSVEVEIKYHLSIFSVYSYCQHPLVKMTAEVTKLKGEKKDIFGL